MDDYVADLVRTVEAASAFLGQVPEAASARRPAPGKWSAREIVGHLVDSAANNHARFVRAQLEEDLVFPGYDQDRWVALQRYGEAPWHELVALWRAYNLHLARVMQAVPREVKARPRQRHNLHQIAFRTVPAAEPASLDYLMRDYVDHLKHHLEQVEARLRNAP
jgi:hypothetical protein